MSAPERLGVIGDPIAHSISPAMQSAALDAAGLDWIYEPQQVSASDLPAWFQTFGKRLRGFNVTIPHKIAVAELVDELDVDARAIGAVNTVANSGGRARGYNTDPAGFLAALASAGFDPADAAVVVFGAGGAARAVVHALRPRAGHITVANRTPDRARRLVPPDDAMSFQAPQLHARIMDADLLVNATSMGMSHLRNASPLPEGVSPRASTFVVDLVYGRDTPLLSAARSAGCTTQDGLEMLVLQGAESFRLWTGLRADMDTMREACRKQLEIVAC